MLPDSEDVKVGCPRALFEKDLKQARALLSDPEITVEDVARRLGVSPSTPAGSASISPRGWRLKVFKL